MTGPRHNVSVIVPTCDRPALLRQALASIRALEGADLTFEILVGDNGSASETRAVVEEFGAVYLNATTRQRGTTSPFSTMTTFGCRSMCARTLPISSRIRPLMP